MNNFEQNDIGEEGFDQATELVLEQLAAKLQEMSAIEAPRLSAERKSRIRSHMFEKIDAVESTEMAFVTDGIGDDAESALMDRLISWMKVESEKVTMSSVKKAVIREKLYDLPEKSWFSYGLYRKVAASFSLGSVLALSLFAYVLRVPVTYAREFTVVHEVAGSVQVVRDGQTENVAPGFELREGDELRTGQDGSVIVKYFDKSFTHFFQNTNVAFQSLKSENFGVDHSVELDLDQGMIWSNVFDLVKNSEFKVKSNDMVTSASKRATFSVSSQGSASQVQVFQNAVSVELPKKAEAKTVVKGFQVSSDSNPAGLVRTNIEPIQLKDDQKQWVSDNLQKDEQLIAEVQKQDQSIAMGPSGVFQQNASLLLAFDPAEKFRLELSVNERSFYETLGKNGVKADEAKAAFDSLELVATKADSLKNEDVKKLAGAVLQSAKGKLLAAKPDSDLYDLKVALEEKDFAQAPSDRKLHVALDQASQFLAEAQLLQDKGLKSVSDKAVEKYKERVKFADQIMSNDMAKKISIDSPVAIQRSSLDAQYLTLRNPDLAQHDAKNFVPVAMSTPVVSVLPVENHTDDARLPPKLQLSQD